MIRRRAALLAVCAASVYILLLLSRAFPADIRTDGPVGAGRRVMVIDAGHGGADGGAVSDGGVSESTVNLSIALRLRDAALLCGIGCVMTRTTGDSIHSPDAVTIRQQKLSDMKNRVEIINAARDAWLVSIHQNSFGRTATGAQVFYRRGSEESFSLAAGIQSRLRLILDGSNDRTAAPVPDSVYIFRNTHCPAVLVECGFISNPQEAALLQTKPYQIKTAVAVAAAFLEGTGGAVPEGIAST